MNIEPLSEWGKLVDAAKSEHREAVEQLPAAFWEAQKRRILAALEAGKPRELPSRWSWPAVAAAAALALVISLAVRRAPSPAATPSSWTSADSADDRLLADVHRHLSYPEGKALEPARLLLPAKEPEKGKRP